MNFQKSNWGPGIYDNDDVMDWIYDLAEEGGLAVLMEALEVVLRNKNDDLDTADCRIALAAADLVAALNGDIDPDIPEEAEDWIAMITKTAESLRPKAEEAVRKVLDSSRLKNEWISSEDYPEWEKTITGLLKRLEL
jgi:hypothetical protein